MIKKPSAHLKSRRTHAVNSFRNAAETIGKIEEGMHLFAITRGQFSMIDAILHTLDQVGRAKITYWTWAIAAYEVESLERLMIDERLTGAELIIDFSAKKRNEAIIDNWKRRFGSSSVRYVVNHAKIATVESEAGHKVLLRGSMNLNFNPRFEQLDVTEGGADFDLVRQLEEEMPTDDNPERTTWTQANERSGINPKDAQLLEARGLSIEEVCRAFGVDPSLVGHGAAVSNWGTGLEQKKIDFLTFTLRPIFRSRAQ